MPKGKRTSQIPANETKRQKFIRLAQPRINKVIKGIESLGKLTTSAYDYRKADADLIEQAITGATAKMLAKFSNQKDSNDVAKFMN